jgi:hypothetical protein
MRHPRWGWRSLQDQRKHPRVKPPKGVLVAWQSGTQRDVSYVENIALEGIFVLTKQRVPLRSLVRILLDLPLGQVRGRAIVRRVLDDHGMAVQFIGMDPEDRGRLLRQMRAFLTEQLSSTVGGDG